MEDYPFGFSDFFFFKQKTAYELRISDWSSDVCSSDLPSARHLRGRRIFGSIPPLGSRCVAGSTRGACRLWMDGMPGPAMPCHPFSIRAGQWRRRIFRGSSPARSPGTGRSEEHTSELQSLMRISYAVLRLQKKKYTTS